MVYLAINNQSKKIIIYIIFVVVLLNYFTISDSYNFKYGIDSLHSAQILAPQYPSENLVIEQTTRYKTFFGILQSTNLPELIMVYSYHLILEYRYLTYIYLHISRLFLLLQRLLLPRQNSSKFKASFNIKYSV